MNSIKYPFILFLCLTLFFCILWCGSCTNDDDDDNDSPPAHVIYVDLDAAGDNDGSTWSNAFTDLQDALSSAASDAEIWVAAGTYKPTAGDDRSATFIVPEDVSVYGGFNGTETSREQREWLDNETTLSGDLMGDDQDFTNNDENVYHVVTGGDHTVLDGFFIIGGNADEYGGGVYAPGVSMNISHCVIHRNYSSRRGGGIFCRSSIMTLLDCSIVNNIAYDDGGGFCGEDSDIITITGCTFKDNQALTDSLAYGGGLSLSEPSAVLIEQSIFQGNFANNGGGAIELYHAPNNTVIKKCFFHDNTARGGGALFSENSVPQIVNCVFVANSADFGGAVYNFDSSSMTLINTTFAYNEATRAGSVRNYESTLEITNSIFWGGIGTETNNEIGNRDSLTIIRYSNVAGCQGSGSDWNTSLGQDGGGNIDQNPLFSNAENPLGADALPCTQDDGLNLQSGSPCIDSGTSTNAPSDDICGTARPQGNGIDMGAYEYAP
ncbi:right-handed parallel beta-helix repeat-containing protein [candidate division CSSED10-310 bacterium]|uniref:Right-handed parallel beta-helix repeat-containing protein n=1 Tax=candidate division CSSED10-310 bacterium TaxID=2855610 RepID=A0ABV6YVW3_UNCC1